ncbi:DUF6346 domain-containing protein [Amycolatopsis magusensis]|uniref:DUF6346 domain-containing protein n=1 Tax=Amycolatopsis magusensis TaxID=882444 RepID=UPI0037A0B7CE
MHVSVLARIAQQQTLLERLGGFLRFVVFWLTIPATFFLSLTLLNLDDVNQRDAAYTVDETGAVAYVKQCTEYGPISHAGFGYHWGCSVDYGGGGRNLKPYSERTQSDMFTPDDVGMTFAVKKIGKQLHRYHEVDRVSWGSLGSLYPFLVVGAIATGQYWGIGRWAVGSLALGIKLTPNVGRRYIEKLLRQGRLVARPYDPGFYPEAAATVELTKVHGHWVKITKTGITSHHKTKYRHRVLTWSLRWSQLEKLELTAFYRPDDEDSEYPIARVMDICTIPRDLASRDPGLKKHWGAMGIEGGARFEYFLSREKAMAINSTNAAYQALRTKGPR